MNDADLLRRARERLDGVLFATNGGVTDALRLALGDLNELENRVLKRTLAPDTVHLFGARTRSDADTVRLAVEALRVAAPAMADSRVEAFAVELARRLAEEATP